MAKKKETAKELLIQGLVNLSDKELDQLLHIIGLVYDASGSTLIKTTKKKITQKVEIFLQSPMGGEITPEMILAKVGQVDKVYVRLDQNKIYWVKGDETGAVDIW